MKKSAQVVILNKEGLVLAVSRKDNHSDFGLPGGKMDPEDNDDPTETAIRETFEETGIRIWGLHLIFAMHKDGYMGYTYIAYGHDGEINHNEPHVVKWVPFDIIINGSFGKFNKLVSESLSDMGIKYQLNIDEEALKNDASKIIDEHYNGELKIDFIRKSWMGNSYDIFFVDEKFELEETFGDDKKLDDKLEELHKKYNIRITINTGYYCK